MRAISARAERNEEMSMLRIKEMNMLSMNAVKDKEGRAKEGKEPMERSRREEDDDKMSGK